MLVVHMYTHWYSNCPIYIRIVSSPSSHTQMHTHLVDVISFSGGGDTEALPIHRLHLKVADVTVHLPPRRGTAPIAEHRLCSGGGGEVRTLD